MKITEPNEWGNRLRSEGKILEIIPLLYTADGSVLSLPPVSYPVPNWLLGMEDEYITGYPMFTRFNEQMQIPGSNTRFSHRMSFFCRVVEQQPDSTPQPATFDAESVAQLLDYLKSRETEHDA